MYEEQQRQGIGETRVYPYEGGIDLTEVFSYREQRQISQRTMPEEQSYFKPEKLKF
jgi:hypothetical protein